MFAAKAVTANDRVTLVDFWARCLQKVAQLREVKRTFEQERRTLGAKHPLVEEGKTKSVTQFNQELDLIQENMSAGILKQYVTACDLIEEILTYILCIEQMLIEASPDRRDRITGMNTPAIPAVMTPEPLSGEAKEKKTRKVAKAEPEPEAAPQKAPAEEEAPPENAAKKSSFQQIMEKKA